MRQLLSRLAEWSRGWLAEPKERLSSGLAVRLACWGPLPQEKSTGDTQKGTLLTTKCPQGTERRWGLSMKEDSLLLQSWESFSFKSRKCAPNSSSRSGRVGLRSWMNAWSWVPKTPWKLAATQEKKKKKDAEQESKLEFETKNGKNALLGFGDVNFKMGSVGGMDLWREIYKRVKLAYIGPPFSSFFSSSSPLSSLFSLF